LQIIKTRFKTVVDLYTNIRDNLSDMEYQDVVKDFARRTRTNLEFIRAERANNPKLEIYEVTQLINSLLGLLVFPQQKYINEIPKTPLNELAGQGWPIPKVLGNYSQVGDLNQLVRCLRNSIAHFNIVFLSDSTLQIKGLKVWNIDTRGKIT
jgi:hypothetical protein